MYISLRKAAALQKEISAALPEAKLDISVSIYSENPMQEISEANERLAFTLHKRLDLLEALYEIRQSVAEVNLSSGITAKVNALAFMERSLQDVSAVVLASATPAEAVIRGRMAKSVAQENMYTAEVMNLSVLSEADITVAKESAIKLKRSKANIQDQLLELNIKNNIKLSEAAQKTLSDAGLI